MVVEKNVEITNCFFDNHYKISVYPKAVKDIKEFSILKSKNSTSRLTLISMAISYLHDAFGQEFKNLQLSVLNKYDEKKIKIIEEMIEKKVNSPDTSSLGRLFDSIAAICQIRDTVHFEGQAAMELEMTAGEKTDEIYDYEWNSGDIFRILPGPVIRGVVKDIKNGVHISKISSKFHQTLVVLFSDL